MLQIWTSLAWKNCEEIENVKAQQNEEWGSKALGPLSYIIQNKWRNTQVQVCMLEINLVNLTKVRLLYLRYGIEDLITPHYWLFSSELSMNVAYLQIASWFRPIR